MALNPNIILQGQQPDFVNTLARATQAADAQNGAMRRNNLASLYASQGDKIAQGDQGALNALAMLDPTAAQGVQQNNLSMDATRLGMQNTQQSMGFARENMGIVRETAKREAEAATRNMSAAEAKAAADRLSGIMNGAMAANDEQSYNAYLTQNGIDPATAPFGQRDMNFAKTNGYLDALKVAASRAEATAGPEWVSASPAEAAAQGYSFGQINRKTGQFKGTNGPKEGITITNKDGSTVTVGGNGKGTKTGMDPSSPESMVASIDGILNDPALDSATGVLAWTQNIPGTSAKRFGTRTKQLDGQAFLQAFESLKGAGQITEVEGTKATQAIGRLDTAQSADDYRAALNELKSVLVLGQQRPLGWANGQADPTLAQGNTPEVGAVENGYSFKGGDPSDPANWEASQ